MADAISYLIRVAKHSGMGGIATKLGRVRSELLILASQELGEADPDSIVVPRDPH